MNTASQHLEAAYNELSSWIGPFGVAPRSYLLRLTPEAENGYVVDRGRPIYLFACPSDGDAARPWDLWMATSFCNRLHRVENTAGMISIGEEANRFSKPRFRPFLALGAYHEMAHLAQANVIDRTRYCHQEDDAEHSLQWITEGTADALAIRYVRRAFGRTRFGPLRNPYFGRFYMLRPYYLPINWQPNDASPEGLGRTRRDHRILAYRAHGFWDHVLDRYLKPRAAGAPEAALFEFLETDFFSAAHSGSATQRVDAWLDSIDGEAMTGFEHVYPQFLTEIAQWSENRFDGGLRQGEADHVLWSGCPEVTLRPGEPTVERVTLIPDYAGKCATVKVLGAPKDFKGALAIKAAGDRDGVDALYVGVAAVTGTQSVDMDCFEHAQGPGRGLSAPCLLPAEQAQRAEPGGGLQRYFSLDIDPVDGGEAPTAVRLIFSVAPSEHVDYRLDEQPRERVIDLEFTLEHGRITGDEAVLPAALGYQRRLPRGPQVRGRNPRPDPDSALRGEFDARGLVRAAAGDDCDYESRNAQFSAVALSRDPGGGFDEAQDGVSVRLVDQDYRPGAIGTFKGVGTARLNGQDYVPANLNPTSEVEIRRNEDGVLVFRATALTCLAPPDGAADIGSYRLYAESGACLKPMARFAFEGAVAFPRNAECGSEPRYAETDASRAFAGIRLANLRSLGLDFGLLRAEPGGAPAGAGAPSAGSGGAGGGAGGGAVDACPAQLSAGCACSCENKRCADTGHSAVSPGCKLLCANDWRACP